MDSSSTSTGNPTTEEQIVAILRRSESHAHSQIASLKDAVQKLRDENGNLQNLLKESKPMVRKLKVDLTIARKDKSRSDEQLRRTRAQVKMLVEQNRNHLDERVALLEEVMELNAACDSLRAAQQSSRTTTAEN